MNNHPQTILDLPSEITIDILTRLPLKTIISCKCACKKWLGLLSTPEFAESHLPKTTPGLIVYITQNNKEACQIFEFDDALELQNHDLHHTPVLKFDPRSFINSPADQIISIECSVNGLLCLQDFDTKFDSLYICNPITREYIPLPKLEGNAHYPNIVTYGFGVSLSSREYKVVRIFHEPKQTGPGSTMPEVECLVYTIGTGSWKSIASGDYQYEYNLRHSIGAFMNGSLHWLVGDATGSQVISRLDLEMELFEPFSAPPFPSYFPYKASLVVVRDCLWFCDYGSDEEIVVWVMKEYGVKESWVKQVVIDKWLGDLDCLTYESVYPLKAFRDGDILFLWEDGRLFYYSDETQTAPKVEFFERDTFRLEAILHTSTFVSLRNFVNENVITF